MIKPEIIQKVRDTAEIVEVVGDFVQLKKAGQSYKGLSPFTDEKTPSFFVSPNKNIFKCFSTSKGGDSIKFIMDLEGLSYIEAIRFLAQKYNIELEEEVLSKEALEKKDKRESLFIALDFAKNFFKDLLKNSADGKSIGVPYFKERGFDSNTIEVFELGYSANQWDGLIKEAKKKHYTLDVLESAGLIIKKEDGKTYDRFRNRVMFPIHNLTGKVIAFGARILINDKKQPKYINSPETEVYHKSSILYGIFQAKNEIRNKDNCYLVEGYTDVISLYQSGIKNVVASSGTSLTTGQIKIVSRYTKNITVLYDGDTAGIRASIRGIDMLLEEGMNVHTVTFPDGQDPDSYCQEIGGLAFSEFLEEEKIDFITFKTQLYLQETKNDPLKKAAIIRNVIESISKIPDSIKRAIYFKESAGLLDVREEVLIHEYNTIYLNKRAEASKVYERDAAKEFVGKGEMSSDLQITNGKQVGERQTFEDQEKEVIRILVNFADEPIDSEKVLGDYLLEEIKDVDIHQALHKRILEEFRTEYSKGNKVGSDYFLNHSDEEFQGAAIGFLATKHEISPNWDEKFQIIIKNESDQLGKVAYLSITRLKWRKIRFLIKEHQEEIVRCERDKDEDKAIQILEKIMFLKKAEMEIAKILGNVATG